MALSGLHVTCGFVGIRGGMSLLATPSWSQTMTTAGTTSLAATEPKRPTQQFDGLLLAFQVYASADSYVAIGQAPDATQVGGASSNTARIFVPGGQTFNVLCNSGDLLAWTPA